MEDQLVKNIENGIRGLKLGTKKPSELNLNYQLNKLKSINEGLADDLNKKYIEAVKNSKK